MFNIAEKLDDIDLSSELGMMIERSDEYQIFEQEINFIQKSIDVLENETIAQKKSFFIDNQERVTVNLKNLNDLVEVIDNNDLLNNGDSDIVTFAKLVHMVHKHLENGIAKFNSELTNGVSPQTTKEDIVVSEDTIKDAMQNNNATQEIAKELKNLRAVQQIDEQTAKIRESFKDMKQQKQIMQQQFRNQNRKTQIQSQSVGYLITSRDFSEFKMVQGANLSKEELNKMIEKSGIDDARVFQLTEIPTKKQTIQKVVTVIG